MIENECGILDLSGYMFSGKAAVSDFVREFGGISLPNYREEFDLIRIPRGVGDLMRAFESGSLITISNAINSYKEVANEIARPARGWRRLTNFGGNYEYRFPGFTLLTESFLEAFIEDCWKVRSPYEVNSLSALRVLQSKISAKLFGEQSWPEIPFYLGSRKLFYPAARNYFQQLLCNNLEESVIWKVTHNALEPHKPSQFFPLFKRVKAIVVDRDVRDIYMTATTHSLGFNDSIDTYKRIAGAHDVKSFILRQKAMRQLGKDHAPDILHLNFEDLIENYDNSKTRILTFLGLARTAHKSPFLFFNPEISRKNTRLWLQADVKQREAIRTIEMKLPELCRL